MLGQYGVHKEYDDYGREMVLTYLDADGNPLVTNKGYTTLVRTYQANNSVATEKYYDLEGNPYSLSEGQYGIKRKGRQTVYLDKEGKTQVNLKTLLYNNSWLVIVITIVVIFFSTLIGKRWNMLFLILYLFVIIYLTLMFRDSNNVQPTEFLWYYKRIIVDNNARSDILKNIWLFIPLGAYLYKHYPHKVILVFPVILSIIIEGIQYIIGIGCCELDDVISNSLGGVIGFYIANRINMKEWERKINYE